MKRVSNHQLKALLENLESAASVDHPLSVMFRGMIKEALLDLRDLVGENHVLAARLEYKEGALKSIKEEIIPAQDKPGVVNNLRYRIAHSIDWAEMRNVDEDAMHKRAIFPLTGKEK